MHSAMEFEPRYKAFKFYSIVGTQGLLPLDMCRTAEIGGASAQRGKEEQTTRGQRESDVRELLHRGSGGNGKLSIK